MPQIPNGELLIYVRDMTEQLAAMCQPNHRALAAALLFAAEIARDETDKRPARLTGVA